MVTVVLVAMVTVVLLTMVTMVIVVCFRDGSAVELVGLCKASVRWLADMNRQGHYPYSAVNVHKQGINPAFITFYYIVTQFPPLKLLGLKFVSGMYYIYQSRYSVLYWFVLLDACDYLASGTMTHRIHGVIFRKMAIGKKKVMITIRFVRWM